MIKVIIVDDHTIFRNGLKILLDNLPNVKVVAEAADGNEFLERLEKQPIQVAFMDINMPNLDGIVATEIARRNNTDLKIIALTAFNDKETLYHMLEAGVDGFMLKNSEIHEFQNAINKVLDGQNFFSDEILKTLTNNLINTTKRTNSEIHIPTFSERELEVLKQICQGYSNVDIGKTLNISDRTVERYKTRLIEKTETKNTLNLVISSLTNVF